MFGFGSFAFDACSVSHSLIMSVKGVTLCTIMESSFWIKRSEEIFFGNPGNNFLILGLVITPECPKIYRISVLHMLKCTANLYLSRCSKDLR